MTHGRILGCALVAALLSLPLTARAGGGHRSLPELDGKRPGLTMRVVRYTGGTNGKMVVEVRNPGRRAAEFDPKGLYFVPDGDPEKAPQRLGAAGPFEVSEAGQWKPQKTLRLGPGGKALLQLQVFCIDSHRSSPSASNVFRMAGKRLPKNLRREITVGADRYLMRAKGRMPAAKSAIQSHIWKTRDAKWIKLEGERTQEKSPPRMRHQRPMRRDRIHKSPDRRYQQRTVE